MVVDIFIKTYHKDFIWLKYCLGSIQKFAQGFRKVVIVSDDDGHIIPPEFLKGLTVDVHYTKVPTVYPENPCHGIGYLWQQIVKLNWYTYTDADTVLILDSDWMLTVPTTPENFMVDGKFTWGYRDWDKVGDAICWKAPTELLFKNPAKYEAMPIAGFMLVRNTSMKFMKHMCHLYNVKTIWDIFVQNNIGSLSEFNLFGTFIEQHDTEEYTKLYNYEFHKLHNITILTSWSWGGLKDEDKARRDAVLLS
jgi:hypothetical protein